MAHGDKVEHISGLDDLSTRWRASTAAVPFQDVRTFMNG